MNDNLLNSLMKRLEIATKNLKLAAADNMTSVTTTDGDTLSIDGDVTIGSTVYSQDENGNLTPAEDGDYTLDDGTIITVSGGSISSISGDPNADTQSDTTSPDTEMTKEKLADAATAPTDTPASNSTTDADPNTEARLEALEATVAQLVQALSTSTTCTEQLSNENKFLKEKVEKLSAEPAKASIKQKAIELSNDKLSVNDSMEAIRKIVQSKN